MNELPQADRFCADRTDHPYWNESVWFSFSVPERGIHGFIYYFFRPNMNLLVGGPAMWDGSGASNWNCLYHDWPTIQAIPPGAEKFNFTAPNSLSVEIIEPLKRYGIRYDRRGFKLALEWQAISEPHSFLGMEIEATGASADNRLHIEQCGRIKGQIELRDEVYQVDCYSLRDTSYGKRQLDNVTKNAYFWGIASPESAFHAMVTGEGDDQNVIGGFLIRDGKMATLKRGFRRVIRRGSYTPAEFRLEAEDELGRTLEVAARSSSDFLFSGYPDCQIVWSMLDVEFDGQKGLGDLQECTPLEQFRERIRSSSS